MNRWLKLFFLLALTIGSQGCKYLKTREITFYREAGQGLPVAVDVIYPRDAAERDSIVREFGQEPMKWFPSEQRGKVVKDKVDVPVGSPTKTQINSQNRPKKDIGVVVIAEFGDRPANSSTKATQKSVIQLNITSDPKPKKKELILIDQGYMKRLKRPPGDDGDSE